MSEAAVTLSRLTKNYGTNRGVKNLNLEVKPGQVFGFLGPNGAGKTTTIRMMLDLIRPTGGKITLLGLDSVNDSVELRRRVGYLSGETAMDHDLTGAQYLDYMAKLKGGVNQQYLKELIKRLGCELDKKLGQLSRGNKQKIGLTAALMHEPDLLILDEPTSGLDPLLQSTFYELMREHTAAGRTAFISSHVLSEVQHICDSVGFIREGELVDVQTLNDLMKKSFKSVQIWTNDELAESLVKKTRHVTDVAVHSGVVHCRVHGDPTALLATLANLKVRDVLIEEASLDDLFMHYYREAKHV